MLVELHLYTEASTLCLQQLLLLLLLQQHKHLPLRLPITVVPRRVLPHQDPLWRASVRILPLRASYFCPCTMFCSTSPARARASTPRQHNRQKLLFCTFSKLQTSGFRADVSVTVTKRQHDLRTRRQRRRRKKKQLSTFKSWGKTKSARPRIEKSSGPWGTLARWGNPPPSPAAAKAASMWLNSIYHLYIP
jgi:hypothetical protein